MRFYNTASPELSLAGTFAVLIFGGAVLLWLPGAHSTGISFLDALFTSTSAVCVTGLTVVPTSGFTYFGQGVLMMLMQAGGIGIMTMSAGLVLILKGELDFGQRLHAAQVNETYNLTEVEGVLGIVLRYTFMVEAFGFSIMSVGFMSDGYGFFQSLYYGAFHTISAFNNAGFAIFDDNMMSTPFLVNFVVMMLIIFGGLGYYVAYDIRRLTGSNVKLSIHTRVVLISTVTLIFLGAALIWLFEGGDIGIFDAFFQSVSPRTAGFNTVDLAALRPSTVMALLVLMYIGAAPGSTGGGVKITTAFTALMAVFSMFRGEDRLVIFKRTIPQYHITRSFVLVMLYTGVIFVGSTVLLAIEPVTMEQGVFEVVSALGTVGLSLGITPALSGAGKSLVILLMYLGRIGPAVLVVIFIRKARPRKVLYPEDKIILG